MCSYIKDYKKAQMYYEMIKALNLPENTTHRYMTDYDYALLLVNENKYENAVNQFRQLASYAKQNEMSPFYLCSAFKELYKIYQELNETDSTLYYMNLCKKIAEQNNYIDVQTDVYMDLSSFYDKRKNKAKALDYKSKYLSLNDSIFNQRKFNQIKNIHYHYETNKAQQRIYTLNKEKEEGQQKIRAQRKILIIIVSTALIITILLYLVNNQRLKLQRSYRNLFNINKEIVFSEKQHKEQRKQYETEIIRLRNKLQGQQPDITSIIEENDNKYQTSKLTEEQKSKIYQSICQIMENTLEFCQDDFSLEKLAKLINSNSKYVSQVINEIHGKNFTLFVNEYRINEVRMRLADTENYGNYTIQAIAESVGYKSHSTFSKIFREITGMTPSMYQKMAKR